MSPFSELADWIQPHHLEETNISTYQKTFADNNWGVLNLQNFLKEERIADVSRYLVENGQYERRYGLLSVEGHSTTQENWLVADPKDHFYVYDDLKKFDETHHNDSGYKTYRQMRKMLLNPAFYKYIDALTAISLIGIRVESIHCMRKGDYISRHTDKEGSRRLTLLLYFTPNWKPEHGGQLRVNGRDQSSTTVNPTYNSCVIFDMAKHKTHEVTKILPSSSEIGRLSLGCRLHESKKNA